MKNIETARQGSVQRGGAKGQAVLEMVPLIPVAAIILMVLVDFGLSMYEYVAVVNAVREGGRYASVNCPPAGGGTPTCTQAVVKQRVLDRSSGIVKNLGEVDVWWCHRGGSSATWPKRGDSVRVDVKHPYTFHFIRVHTFQLGSRIDLTVEEEDPSNSAAVFGPSASHPC